VTSFGPEQVHAVLPRHDERGALSRGRDVEERDGVLVWTMISAGSMPTTMPQKVQSPMGQILARQAVADRATWRRPERRVFMGPSAATVRTGDRQRFTELHEDAPRYNRAVAMDEQTDREPSAPVIRPFANRDRDAVVALWAAAFPRDPVHNVPERMIDLKLRTQPELFLVATVDDTVVGALMAGFDGVRSTAAEMSMN
jgi:hypothetical protein